MRVENFLPSRRKIRGEGSASMRGGSTDALSRVYQCAAEGTPTAREQYIVGAPVCAPYGSPNPYKVNLLRKRVNTSSFVRQLSQRMKSTESVHKRSTM